MQVKYEPWVIRKDNGNEAWGVKILEGKFNELTIAINDVKMSDESDGTVSLDYDVVYSLIPTEELKGEEFDQTISFIIQDILVKAMNEYENRNRNTAESSNG